MFFTHLRSRAASLLGGLFLLFPLGALAVQQPQASGFEISADLNDAWYNPETAGQGFLITVLPETGIVFLAWFTYDTEQAVNPGTAELGEPNHRWLTAQGAYSGDSAFLDISVTSGGAFDAGNAVDTQAYGTMTLSFESCNSGVIEYEIPSAGKTGTIPIQRVVPDNVQACEQGESSAQHKIKSNAQAVQAGLINTGINDAWFNPATSGQGFLVTVLPKAGIVFLAWFTHEVAEASGSGEAHLGDARHRWVTAQGPYTGNKAEMNITVSSGGVFDTPTTVTNHSGGTLTLDLFGCNAGRVSYDIPAIGRQGQVPIQRVVGDNIGRCEAQATTTEAWNYWQHEDVKGLDDWGEQADTHPDLVALYQKDTASGIALRVDYMDLTSGSLAPTFLGLDFKTGGVRNVLAGNNQYLLDLDWDVLIVAEGTTVKAFDAGFNELPGAVTNVTIDRNVDYLSFDLDDSVLNGWNGSAFNLQALTTNNGKSVERDRTAVAYTDDVTGRGKLVIHLNTAVAMHAPYQIWDWDGYVTRPEERPDERHGVRYLFDAAEKYRVPISISDVRTDTLPGWEFFGIAEQFRRMHESGLLQLSSSTTYGQFMSWWPDSVNQKAIDLTLEIKERMDIPSSELFYPYESMVRARDVELIRQNGFSAIYVCGWYAHWLDAHVSDFSDWASSNAHVRTTRKINRVNGMDIIFDPQAQTSGVIRDVRWPPGEASNWSWSWLTRGSDQGLHLWYRRSLLDMALDVDQQQFTAAGGDDIQFTDWQFKDVAEYNFEWLASHPWIEVTTYEDILGRGWDVVDHGYLDIEPDEHLRRFPMPGDIGNYNTYFEQHYYGGISDGHSAFIPAGVEIEALYDFLPYLRDGQPIPSGRIFGDYKTPGTLAYETIANLESAPDNEIADLAWLMFLNHTGEITFHWQETLLPISKARATHLPQSNKIVEAAHWAQAAAEGQFSAATVTREADLDLDGENEYIIHNDRVFAILENDGGRVEYAFARSAGTGAIQLIAPLTQVASPFGEEEIVLAGEVAMLINQGSDLSAFRDAFSESFEGFFDVMSVEVHEEALVFESPDGTITKTFTLAGDTLTAHYELDGNDPINTEFCFVTNMKGRYERDWNDKFVSIENNQKVGWQSANGGYAVINRTQPWPIGPGSSLDSPTKDEPWQYKNNEGYDWGHWLHFPFSCATVFYQAENTSYDISITLRAESDIME